MLGGMLGNILSGGIQAIAGWAINKAAEWIGNLIYKPSMRANDDRDVAMTEIASRYGGTGRSGTGAGTDFAIVAARLQEATGSNALFERFLKADTPERFAQALREVEAALEAYEKRLEKATDAEREQAKAIEETKNAQQEKIASLREEMKTLSDELAHWDASEAPEEVMGVMERQARDRIAAEQARIQAAIVEQQRLMAEAVEGISETADESRVAITDGYRAGFENARIVAEQFADRLDGLFGDLTYKVNFELGDMPVPGMPVVPAARGFHRDVDSPTLILAGEAGRERVDITPSGGAPSPSSVNITIQAWDGNDVRRVLQSRDFTEALAGIVTQNPGDIRTKLQFGLGVR
jgi:hypothetical protein